MGNCLSCCIPNESQPNTNSINDPASTQPLQNSRNEFERTFATTLNSSGVFNQQPLLIQHQQQQLSYIVESTKLYDTAQTNGNSNNYNNITSSSGSSSGGGSLKNTIYSRLNSVAGEKRNKHNVSETNINALFEQYKDNIEDSILDEGIEKLCTDLNVRPDEFCVLVLAWKFDAKQMCCFTRQEFLNGCKLIKADTIRSIQIRLPEICTQTIQDPELFKDLYRFTFRFGLDIGQRILPIDMAISLWKLVFSQNIPPLLDKWLYFVEKHSHVRGIPRDTWNMFLNFVEAVGTDLSTYDDTEAWPSLFDDFVEFENDQMNQNISKIP